MVSEQLDKSARARRALELFFAAPDAAGMLEIPSGTLPGMLHAALSSGRRGSASAADYANCLYRAFGARPFGENLAGLVFDRFVAGHLLPAELAAEAWSVNTRFLLRAALDLWEGCAAFADVLREEPERVFPAALDFFSKLKVPAQKRETQQLRSLARTILAADRFSTSRTFRYFRGEFTPVEFGSIKPVEKFFGFPSVRAQFQDHFRSFARGKGNLPLLVNSLPGHGKTSMVLSYAYAEPELVIVLPDPVTLESGWDELVGPLAARPDHRFVLFFDDIDPNATDWFHFRTNVGGAFSLPPNVMPVLSANYEFPANILSRGRRVSFPVFDELRCGEMVEDFLAWCGLKHRPRNLISQIAADYTEEFGQKKFTELSPRSLIRYLSTYEKDRNKRRTIVELSMGPMVTRPDAQLFYEFNIDLMRSLYGDEYIKRLLKERLDEISHS